VDVFGHDDVAVDVESVPDSPGFEDVFEEGFGSGGFEVRLAVLTTEGEEVEMPGGLVAVQARRHGFIPR
jgi:hypothetical protein